MPGEVALEFIWSLVDEAGVSLTNQPAREFDL
jgi:hypothetical protein